MIKKKFTQQITYITNKLSFYKKKKKKQLEWTTTLKKKKIAKRPGLVEYKSQSTLQNIF
jgi:hypothetical protein